MKASKNDKGFKGPVKVYFSLSHSGPVRVLAHSKGEALRLLREIHPEVSEAYYQQTLEFDE